MSKWTGSYNERDSADFYREIGPFTLEVRYDSAHKTDFGFQVFLDGKVDPLKDGSAKNMEDAKKKAEEFLKKYLKSLLKKV